LGGPVERRRFAGARPGRRGLGARRRNPAMSSLGYGPIFAAGSDQFMMDRRMAWRLPVRTVGSRTASTMTRPCFAELTNFP
jgi:hypothetical protein